MSHGRCKKYTRINLIHKLCTYISSPPGTPVKGTFLSKLWPGKTKPNSSSGIKVSQSGEYGSTLAEEFLPAPDNLEESLPMPPPLPSLELLLSKRPTSLRGKKHSSHEKALAEGGDESNSDIESDHSSVSSTQSDQRSQQKKKGKKRKRRGSKEDEAFDWQYNKLTVPQSSPPRERKGINRKPTPRPKEFGAEKSFQNQRNLSTAFDEVSHELEFSASPSSISPLHSPSPKSPVSSPNQVSPSLSFNQITGYLNKSTGSTLPAQPAPSFQNRGNEQPQLHLTTLSNSGRSKASLKEQPESSHGQAPGAFMADLNQAIKKVSSTPQRLTRQLASPPLLLNQVCIIIIVGVDCLIVRIPLVHEF